MVTSTTAAIAESESSGAPVDPAVSYDARQSPLSPVTVLIPRPYSATSGHLRLLPLLPVYEPSALPSEIWERIFLFVMSGHDTATRPSSPNNSRSSMGNGRPRHAAPASSTEMAWRLVSVSRNFKDIALPLIYSRVSFSTLVSFRRFYKRIHEADQAWDSIRLNPYSSPGRWVQSIDISSCISAALLHAPSSEACGQGSDESRATMLNELDALLSKTIPLVPFLSQLILNDFGTYARDAGYTMSQRVWAALDETDGIRLRDLRGLIWRSDIEDAKSGFALSFKHSNTLTSLEVRGAGFEEDVDALELQLLLHSLSESPPPLLHTPLTFTHLQTLTLLSIPTTSHLFISLLLTPLPRLTSLTLTPYTNLTHSTAPPSFHNTITEDILSVRFLETHGKHLKKLSFITPRAMGVRSHKAPDLDKILVLCPELRWLELEPPYAPSPALRISFHGQTQSLNHPLQMLVLPRPCSSLLGDVVEPLLAARTLSQLRILQFRDVKWLASGSSGMSRAAAETGVQGEMRLWKRKLASRWNIRTYDGAGFYGEE